MSHAAVNSTKPRAMIHKRILDVALEQPEASLDEIAAQVSSANTALVDRVLDEYGDPADPSHGEDEETDRSDSSDPPSWRELSEKQRQTLQAIYGNPDASQREIAAILDVTAPTVSRRVNSIDGFDWRDRHTIATVILDTTVEPDSETASSQETDTAPSPDPNSPPRTDDDTPPRTDDDTPPRTDDDTPPEPDTDHPPMQQNAATREPLEELADRLTDLERQLESTDDAPTGSPFGGDTELLHKVIHACMESETITQDEELRILKQLLQ